MQRNGRQKRHEEVETEVGEGGVGVDKRGSSWRRKCKGNGVRVRDDNDEIEVELVEETMTGINGGERIRSAITMGVYRFK